MSLFQIYYLLYFLTGFKNFISAACDLLMSLLLHEHISAPISTGM